MTGTKLTLSMKDADQTSGEDLTPHMRLPGQPLSGGATSAAAASSSNPTRPSGPAGASAGGGGDKRARDDRDEPRRVAKRLTSPERFEAKQLIASGVLDVRDYPQFDEEHGMLAVEETEEEVSVEIHEDGLTLTLTLTLALALALALTLTRSRSRSTRRSRSSCAGRRSSQSRCRRSR